MARFYMNRTFNSVRVHISTKRRLKQATILMDHNFILSDWLATIKSVDNAVLQQRRLICWILFSKTKLLHIIIKKNHSRCSGLIFLKGGGKTDFASPSFKMRKRFLSICSQLGNVLRIAGV